MARAATAGRQLRTQFQRRHVMISRLHLTAARRPSESLPSGRVISAVVSGAAVLVLAACGAPSSDAAATAGHGTTVASASASASAAGPAPAPAPPAGAGPPPPGFFADLVQGEPAGQSQLQVRDSVTGRLVAQDRQILASGLAALAGGRTFVGAGGGGDWGFHGG